MKKINLNINNDTVKEAEKNNDFAIIGMVCRMPHAADEDEFWDLLRNGTDGISNISKKRKRYAEEYLSGCGISGYTFMPGAYLDDIDCFDRNFFGISPKEADLMNPSQRIFLELVWQLAEKSGYGKNRLKGTKTGVFLGYDPSDKIRYSDIVASTGIENENISSVGNIDMVTASRISYLLDLKGPAILVNTACSSSLVAVHYACNSIINGDCDMAIAGGIRVSAMPAHNGSSIGIVSSDARTHTFDDSSNGTGGGEGAAAIMIKPLKKAVNDCDAILGVINGSAVNQDGATIGITAPSSESQTNVIVKAWEKANIHVEDISYIEAHGTGTSLGDPIEIQGITSAFSKFTDKKQFCAIGSLKSNIGHLDTAAGIAAIVKVLLAMKNKELPASINFVTPNRKIDFINSPVYVNDRLRKWEPVNGKLLAGVSAFGLGGTNCHIILENYDNALPISCTAPEEKYILTLSAVSVQALIRIVKKYYEMLSYKNEKDLLGLTYTANTGRERYSYCLALIFKSCDELLEQLKIIVNGNFDYKNHDGIYFGKIDSVYEITDDIYDNNSFPDYEKIAHYYISGGIINWNRVYSRFDVLQKHILPAYSFDKYHCWVKCTANNPRNVIRGADAVQENFSAEGKTALENVTEAVKDVLGFQEIDVNSNLYDLGMDSIIAIQIVNKINKIYNINMNLTDILTSPNILSVSKIVEGILKDSTVKKDNIVLNIHEHSGRYKASSPQKRLYILNEIEDVDYAYHMPFMLYLSSKADEKRIYNALLQLIKANEILRTRFCLDEEELYQIVDDNISIDENTEYVSKDALIDYAHDFIKPFNLSNDMLIRTKLVKTEDEYVLIVDIHHIISDGTSIGIFINSLIDCYERETIDPPAAQYSDYSESQLALKESKKAEDQILYWKKELSETEQLNLPYDFKPSPSQKYSGSKFEIMLDDDICKDIMTTAQNNNVTLSVFVFSCFNILLHHYTGQEKIVVGIPALGRYEEQYNNIIGMFVNTLAIVNSIEKGMTVSSLLQQVKQKMFCAMNNQDVPFEEIVSNVDVEKFTTGNTIFDVFYSFQKAKHDISDSILLKYEEIELGCAKFPLSMYVLECNDGIKIEFEYCTGLFKEETIQRMTNNFLNILQIASRSEEIEIDDIDYISDEEKDTILVKFNDTECVYPSEKTMVDFFEENVQCFPNKTAIMFGEDSMTYSELNSKVNRLANYLIKKGVGHGDIVAIYTDRSFEMVIAILAALKAGAAYLPIDTHLPQNRIDYIIDNSKAKCILIQNVFCDKFEHLPFVVDLNSKASYEETDKSPEVKILPNDLAYVIYTSGSTGNPKGVMIEHTSLVNRINWMQKKYPMTFKDIILQKTTYAFDVSVWELFWWSMVGASVCMLEPNGEKDPRIIEDAIYRYRITVMHFVPSMLNIFLNRVKTSERLRSLKYVFSSGESLNPQEVNMFYRLFGKNDNTMLINLYGPTEATIDVSYFDCVPDENLEVVPIGKPIDNIRLYVLNDHKKLCPIGVPGELYIAGVGVARGYINNAELTDQKFGRDIFNDDSKMYQTGDLAKWSDDGNIIYLGRKDFQVKIRGLRIELNEIENRILEFSSIQKAVVIDRKLEEETVICAYIVSEEKIDVKELKQYLKEFLPQYMIPNYIIQIDTIELTSNGKVDRKKLPPPIVHESETTIKVEQSSDHIEQFLIQIWEKLLKQHDVTVDENFFDIGGDSFLLIRMRDILEKKFGIELKMADLFSNVTIRELTNFIQELVAPNDNEISNVENNDIKEIGEKDVAIIGMAMRLPFADNESEFRSNLRNGVDSIGVLSSKRKEDSLKMLESMGLSTDKIHFLEGAFLNDISEFDASFFNISAAEAVTMDPHHRIMLETVYNALENSGHSIDDYYDSNTNVYIGYSPSAYSYQTGINHWRPDLYTLGVTGNNSALIAGRISYLFNLKGESLIIDTACSSSMTALHHAFQDILENKCSAAIVGSVRLLMTPVSLDAKIGIESSDGRTKTFDSNSDGTGIGEGAAALILKPLHQAIKDGDNIHAVIKATSINQDGRSIGLTAPNPDSQKRLIIDVWKKSKVDEISFVEAHGTGTKLGDPIEIQALNEAIKQFDNKRQDCAVGSVKTNIGHLDAAAGIIGVIKSVISLKNNELMPSLHFRSPNKEINFIDSGLYVNTKLTHPEIPLKVCGVSSFGLSGTNVHAVLERYDNAQPVIKEKAYVLAISAKNTHSLYEIVHRYKLFVQELDEDKLYSMCYTANIGRKHYRHRTAFVFTNRSELDHLLMKYLSYPDGMVYAAEKSLPDEYIEAANMYINGNNNCFDKLYSVPARIAVPEYAFYRKRYWITDSNKKNEANDSINNLILEPYYKKYEGRFVNENYSWEGVVILKNGNCEKAITDLIYAKASNVSIPDVSEASDKIVEFMENYKKILIVNMLPLCASYSDSLSDLKNNLSESAYSLYSISKTIAQNSNECRIELVTVTRNSMCVNNSEEHILPEGAVSIGISKVLPLERIVSGSRCIDIDAISDSTVLVNEILSDSSESMIYIRNDQKMLPSFKKAAAQHEPIELLKKDKVYIITGGIGGIGISIAQSLAEKEKIKIALIGRSNSTDEKNRSRIKKLESINSMKNSFIKYYQADITSEEQFAAVVSTIKSELGEIKGILHCAGVAGNGFIFRKSVDEFTRVASPKVYGTKILGDYAIKNKIDFFVMFSSITSIFGDAGQSDYTAANAFLDSYAGYLRKNGVLAMTINWGSWREIGMAVDNGVQLDEDNSLKTDEAVVAFKKVFSYFPERVVICKEKPEGVEKSHEFSDKIKILGENVDDTERYLGYVWCDLLELNEININDNLFDLGINSLMAVKFESIVEKEGYTVKFSDIYNHPTIRKLNCFINNVSVSDVTAENENDLDKPNNDVAFYEITPYNDIFYRSSCFYNALFAVINSLDGNYKNAVLNDISLFSIDENNKLHIDYDTQLPFEEMLANEGIICSTINKCDDIISQLEKDISNKKVLVVWIDCFYAESRKDTYQKEHWLHTRIIYGYNSDERYFLAIDHTSKDSLNYRAVKISYEEVADVYNGFIENMNKNRDTVSYYAFCRSDNPKNIVGYAKRYIERSADIMTKNMSTLSGLINYYAGTAENIDHFKTSADDISDELNKLVWEYRAICIRYEYAFGSNSELFREHNAALEKLIKLQTLLFKMIYTSRFDEKNTQKIKELCKGIIGKFDDIKKVTIEYQTEENNDM